MTIFLNCEINKLSSRNSNFFFFFLFLEKAGSSKAKKQIAFLQASDLADVGKTLSTSSSL